MNTETRKPIVKNTELLTGEQVLERWSRDKIDAKLPRTGRKVVLSYPYKGNPDDVAIVVVKPTFGKKFYSVVSTNWAVVFENHAQNKMPDIS